MSLELQPPLDAQRIPIANLAPSPTNPRKTFTADKIAEMADSIRRHGILQPILVRPWNGLANPWPYEQIVDADHPRFEIIAGERRWRAAQVAELAFVPVLVRQLTDQETVEFQVIENLHREDLHPLEEAEGYELLMRLHHYTADDLAAKIGKSRAYVYARLKLTALCPEAREAFRAGQLSASTALLVARIPGAALQVQYLGHIINQWAGPVSYRQAAQIAQSQFMLRLADAPFDFNAADLLPEAGSCGDCPKRSGNQPELFADVTSADVCTDPECFDAKRNAMAARQRAEAEAAGRTIISGKAAEKIIPAYTQSLNYTLRDSGYVALDASCYEARHLASPIDEPEPVPPDEPGEDADEAALQAYEEADKKFMEAQEAYEERQEAAIPTYRNLLAGAGGAVATVLVQHPRSGVLVECVAVSDVAQVLKAQGIEKDAPYRASQSQEQKDAEQKAKTETAYRTTLLERILFGIDANADLAAADLKAIALRAWNNLWFDYQKKIAKIFEGEGNRENVELIGRQIKQDDINIPQLLMAIALINEVEVSAYAKEDPEKPDLLMDAADRWGINPHVVRKQVEQGDAAPKKKYPHAIQYKDPVSGRTWTGRGKKPRWVEVRLEEGKSLDELKVAA